MKNKKIKMKKKEYTRDRPNGSKTSTTDVGPVSLADTRRCFSVLLKLVKDVKG